VRRAVKKAKVWGVGDKSNVKVKNATRIEVDGIKFRSKLEHKAYVRLKEEGFNFEYEPESYEIIERFEWNGEKVRPITIKPDFVDYNLKIIMEIKGFANDSWPLRLKLFKRHLYLTKSKFSIYIVKNLKELELFILELKKLKNEK